MNDCLFCKILNKEIESEIIYEDADFFVFLDIKPATNGDTLIIPKKHYKDLLEMPSDLVIKMQELIDKLYKVYKEKLNCIGLTLTTNLEYAQEIKHFHVHFIPRYEDDEVTYLSNKDILEDLKTIQEKVNLN